MGGLSLTRPGIQYDDQQQFDPETGQPLTVPHIQFFKNPSARNQKLASDDDAAIQSAPMTIDPATGGPIFNSPKLPKAVQPSFTSVAAPDASGATPPIAPSETKLGKLVHILGAAARGAAMSAGQPNFGAGFETAQVRPLQMASMRAGVQQQQAQAALTRAQSTQVQTPYGPMPVGLARYMFPALINAGSREKVQGMKGDTAENVQEMKGQTAENVANINKRFMTVPNVGLYDTQQKTLIPQTAQGITVTPEIAQDYGLPQDFVGKPMTLSNFNQLERTAAQYQPSTSVATDPLGLKTTTVRSKQRPGANANGVSPGFATFPSSAPKPAAGGAARAPAAGATGNGSIMDRTAQQLVEGTMDPSQLSKRTAAYTTILDSANSYSQKKYGKPFDVAQAQTDFKYANEPATQNTLKYLNSLTGSRTGQGNLDKLVTMSDSIGRTDFPPINDALAWARLKSGSGPMAGYAATITEVADQVAKILQGGGTGSGTSDAKLNQAQQLFQKGFNTQQIRDVADTLRDLLGNRKRELIGDNRYLQKQFGGSSAPTPQTHIFDPQAWKAANPNGDVNKAIGVAKQRGFTVK